VPRLCFFSIQQLNDNLLSQLLIVGGRKNLNIEVNPELLSMSSVSSMLAPAPIDRCTMK
jgi:hypothetical protein